MPRIELETRIRARIERSFDLARDVQVHCETAAFTGERVLPPGRITGLLELGDEVTFEARHLGMWRRLTARITQFHPPYRFVDEMVQGTFRRLRHIHEFRQEGEETVMRDIIEWESPYGALGRLADRLFVERHMRRFLECKQANLKRLADAPR